MATEAPCGSWKSPISAEMIAGQAISLGGVVLDGRDIYWSESRPLEGGRQTLMRLRGEEPPRELLAAAFSARSRAHEYGGGAFTAADGVVYFVNHADQRIYRLGADGAPAPMTAESPRRYADLLYDRQRARLIAVSEQHTGAGEPINRLVGISADGSERVLAEGQDFYSSPALSPDGRQLAWLAWRHPNMPWDGTELWVAELGDSGEPRAARRVAGSEHESVFQPQYAPDGTLYFVSDRRGWWNLYRRRAGRVEAVVERDAEFGLPQWVFGMSTYGFAAAHEMVCAFSEAGRWCLARLDTRNGAFEVLELPYSEIGTVRAGDGRSVFIAASPSEAAALVAVDLASRRPVVLRRSTQVELDPGYLSRPQAISFPTTGGERSRAFFYAPANRDFRAPPGEKPPLLVMSHGGPTAATSSSLSLRIQFWTSRGFSVLDVNYRGSTGYGRAYREKLNGRWGIADVEDCVHGARFVAAQGWADGQRLAIRGSSAGGFTTLCGLAFHQVFGAAAVYYGVSDLERLVYDTHKFESRYLDRLIGPYPARRDLYEARSPLRHVERLTTPVIFFQGLDDKVVPPDQTERMVEALRARGVPVAYLPFEGEAHGFRRAESIARALEAECYFYARIFAIPPAAAETVPPVTIENL